jgi:hypothetical protein
LAWVQQQRAVQVFVDGEQQVLPASAALLVTLQQLSRYESVPYRSLGRNQQVQAWCRNLLQQGSLQVSGNS